MPHSEEFRLGETIIRFVLFAKKFCTPESFLKKFSNTAFSLKKYRAVLIATKTARILEFWSSFTFLEPTSKFFYSIIPLLFYAAVNSCLYLH